MAELDSGHLWLHALRPKTLPAAAAPVIMGFALAFRAGLHHFPSVIFAAMAALLIQGGTNLVNDYSDFIKGADRGRQTGPVRVVQSGLVTPARMKKWMIAVLALIILVSLPLVVRGGIPILVIGLLSIFFGIIYTAGPFPLGYNGLGDIFVLIFFGPVATAGTYYVQTLSFNMTSVIAGLGPGFISVAILCVNNLRDRDEDAGTGKNTLVVVFGNAFGKAEYLFSLVIAVLIPFFLFLSGEPLNLSLLVLVILVPATKSLKIIFKNPKGKIMNDVLGYTGKLLLFYSIVFSIGWQFPI